MPDFAHILNPGGRFREPETVKAYSSLKRPTEPTLKRSRLKPVGDKKRRAPRVARIKLLDGKGRSIESANDFIPRQWNPKTEQLEVVWPRVSPVKTNEAYEVMIRLFCEVSEYGGDRIKFGVCWRCKEQTQVDLAHIVPRSNECCNLLVLCRECHQWQEKNWRELREILRIKCMADRVHTDFVRIIELRKKLFNW